ncbi:NosD domain-containing protein [Methanolobus sp. WCC4]|uniref:NosD domain-containing protein n=1 Tax=Methanolobus sp. WCC4 TaxID=3125784 RepID=UPI0030F674CE
MVHKKIRKNSTLFSLSKISIVALLAFVLLANCASAATLTVGPSETYTTINAAVTVAVPGDIIVVKPGTYHENVSVLTPGITIMSESSNPEDTVVQASSNSFPNAAFSISADGVVIQDLKISNGYYGVSISSANACIVTNCVVSGNSGTGISVFDSDNCQLTGNVVIYSGGDGMLVALSDNCQVVGNTVSNSRGHGILVGDAMGTILDSNSFINGNPTSYAGISYQRSDNGLLVSNNVSGNYYGIQVDWSDHNTIYNNYLSNVINAGISNVNVGNVWNMPLTPGANIVGGPFNGGNYWARTDGTGFSQLTPDADNDGICDMQYVIDPANIDQFPLAIYNPPVASVSSLAESDVGPTWINWSWTNPSSSNFNHSMVYLDGVFKANVSTEHFNVTGLSDSTSYEIGIRTVDQSSNINTTWVNDTATTLDGTAPASVTGLSEADVGYTWINWSWTNPSDVDFDHCDIYIDGNYFKTVTSECFNATGISQGTVCEIGIMTVDSSGNVNTTLITDSAKTDEQVVVTTVTSKSSGSSSSSNTGTELRIIEPDEDENDEEEGDSVADSEETPLQSTPDVYEEEDEIEIGANIAEEASDATEDANSAPGFGVLTAIGVMVSMVLFRRKD